MRVSNNPSPESNQGPESETKPRRKTKADASSDAGQSKDSAKDANVTLSQKSKPKQAKAPDPDKELTTAEQLVEHANSGKLSAEEKDLALGRVREIIKKYGGA